jgi:hypothetical protein
MLIISRCSVKLEVATNIVAGGTIMPKYDIFASCNACGDDHPMGILVMLQSGPVKKQSIAGAFAGKDLPPNVATLKDNRVYCPRTGRGYAQTDNRKIFLVPNPT